MSRTISQLQAALVDQSTGNEFSQDIDFAFLSDILYAIEFGDIVDGVATPDTVEDGALAISLSTKTTHIDSSGAVLALTIADGFEGQRKSIVMTVAGNNATISANLSVTSIVFNLAGEAVELLFTGATWSVIGVQGATVTP